MNTKTSPIRAGLPPGPRGTLIGGNLRQFRVGLLDFPLEAAREYGPLTSFRVGHRRVFLASAPELIEQVLITDAKHYIKHFGAEPTSRFSGTDWSRARANFGIGNASLFNPYFSRLGCSLNHRDPKYFPEPEEFRPERWKNGFAKRIPKFAYYPFGGGQRMCVGSTFALIEAPIVLATVGQRYRFTVDPEAAIGIKPQITLEPANAIPVTLLRR
jgi:hypothetical protein